MKCVPWTTVEVTLCYWGKTDALPLQTPGESHDVDIIGSDTTSLKILFLVMLHHSPCGPAGVFTRFAQQQLSVRVWLTPAQVLGIVQAHCHSLSLPIIRMHSTRVPHVACLLTAVTQAAYGSAILHASRWQACISVSTSQAPQQMLRHRHCR